jgi:hypothetical protein
MRKRNPASLGSAKRFTEINPGECFWYAGGYEVGSRTWRPEAEYEKLDGGSAMTKHGHRIYQFPTDVLVTPSYEKEAQDNPAVEEAVAPPLYRLNYLECTLGGRKGRVYPAFPVQILPSADSSVVFRFWSSAKYDVHHAFPGFRSNSDCCVTSINYQIIYDHKAHHMVHPFDKARVCLSLDGLHADRVIMRSYKELDDFPKLPADWTYFQFIN